MASVQYSKGINGAGVQISVGATVSCQTVVALDTTIPASSTDLAHPIAIDVSQLVVCGIYASAAMTLETNSGSSPAETISLAAGEAIVWSTGDNDKPLNTDVTAIYVTSTAGGTLKLVAGYSDATP